MPVIHLETIIEAPRERVFDLARSIDAHQDTAEQTGERALAGTTSGLLDLGGEVTWEARHLGVTQRLRVKMAEVDRPNHFRDVMLEGAFREMKHDHRFELRDGCTVMIDVFEFRSPLGPLGWLVARRGCVETCDRWWVRDRCESSRAPFRSSRAITSKKA